jgi:hypothetical protein
MKRLKKLALYSAVAVVSLVLPGCPEREPCEASASEECPEPTPKTIVKISAERTSLRVNESTQLTAWGESADGNPVRLDSARFFSADHTVAEVDEATGVVIARGAGTVTLFVTSSQGDEGLTLRIEGAVHRGTIAQSETWHTKDNPHFLLDTVNVGGSSHPVLTIEPGVVVRAAASTGLRIGQGEPGSLKAEGTAQHPIRFEADTQAPTRGFWGALEFAPQSGTDSKLTYASLSHCGSFHPWSERRPCISIEGNFAGGGARPVLADVTITHGAGSGVVAANDGAFGPGSARVSVKDSGDYPFQIETNYAHTLPLGGTLEGNTANYVELTDGNVRESQTWPDLGMPYVIADTVNVAGPRSPVLSLPAGLVLRMTADTRFGVGDGNPGTLQAVGTEQRPIVFTAHASATEGGFWNGVFFHSQAQLTSRLSYARVEYAGGFSDGGVKGNIVVVKDKGGIVDHTQMSHSGECGIVRIKTSTQEAFTTDFTAAALGNTFDNNPGGDQCGP